MEEHKSSGTTWSQSLVDLQSKKQQLLGTATALPAFHRGQVKGKNGVISVLLSMFGPKERGYQKHLLALPSIEAASVVSQ